MTKQMISTATDRVTTLSQSIKKGLSKGQEYVDLLDQLCQTDSAKELLDATTKLVHLKLDNAFVEFPQHYLPADYYLLFMGRLLDMHQNDGLKVEEDRSNHTLMAKLGDQEVDCSFKFELPDSPAAKGSFFADQEEHEPLFYLNLEDHYLRFSNRALVNFFIVREMQHASDVALDAVIQPLIDFAHYLADDLDFQVDYGILETANKTKFALANPKLALTIIDKLFVATTDSAYQLLNLPHNNGAELVLERGIKLVLSFETDDSRRAWSFKVVDPDEKYSFFSVLLHFKLVRDWYLDNREALHVRSLPLLAKADHRLPTTKKETFVAESGEEPADKSTTVVYQPKDDGDSHEKRQRFDDYDAIDKEGV